ncbi:hypothetical protein M9H77_12579 [Catharanthus roseus]|uniref:Uncharacterized protein n=1 Tax=Catharanthus roseus TaxID=4058 RepID=A0ACC0BHR0_CATRO|nr:hypothetical protein M9H77_12579 [Catharanthus roseus]
MEHSYLFETDILFDSKTNLVNWARKRAKDNEYISYYYSVHVKKKIDRQPYVTLGCERKEGRKKKARLDDNDEDEEEEVQVKRRGLYGTKKCNCPFQLKGEKSVIGDKLKLYVKDGRHYYKIGVYPHTQAQAARLTDDQLKLTEEFSRYQFASRHIMASLLENKFRLYCEEYNERLEKLKTKWRRMQWFLGCLFDKWFRIKVWCEFLWKREAAPCSWGSSQRFYQILPGCANWDGFTSRQCWMDVPDHLIIAANSFNLCIILIARRDSSMILPFYSTLNHVQDTIIIRHLADLEHFIAVIFSLKFLFFCDWFFNS